MLEEIENIEKERKMFSAYTIVFIFLVITGALTWIVPQSVVVSNNGVKEVIYNAVVNDAGEVVKVWVVSQQEFGIF